MKPIEDPPNLYQAAKKYIDMIEKSERAENDTKRLFLHEKRIRLHWEWIDMLESQGIAFQDRDHAVKIALSVAHGKL